MLGLILVIIVLSSVGQLFSRLLFGYRRPFGGFGPWGMGMRMGPPPPMHHGHHHCHHGGPHGPMGHGW